MSRPVAGRSSGPVASARSGGRSAAGSGGGNPEHPLLRSKHIDTLEVLEEYSRDMARLQKENKQLQQQVAKMTSLSGDPYARIEQLETQLDALRKQQLDAQTQEQLAQMEAERARAQAALQNEASKQVASLRSELHVLSQTHAGCVAQRQTLSDQIAALSRTNLELSERATACQTQVDEHRNALERQSDRLRQLEIQATLGPPLPLASAAQATEESKTARDLKAKHQKTKAQLREKDVLLAQQHEQVEQLRAQLAAANTAAAEQAAAHKQLSESHKKLQGEAAALQQNASSAASSARRQSNLRDDLARRDREWAAEKRALQQELDQARRATAANLAATAPRGATSAQGKAEAELLERVAHLQSELRASQSTAETLHAQNSLLRAEHEKVSKALNKMLAAGGGAAGLTVGAGGAASRNDTITIASKRSGFPELIAARRECDALKVQVADLQHALMVAQGRQGGSVAASPTASPAQQQQRLAGARGSLGSSQSLGLIAAHEHEMAGSAASASPTASPGSSFLQGGSVSALGTRNGHGVPLAGRRSSGGWPTAAVAVGSGAGAARIKR